MDIMPDFEVQLDVGVDDVEDDEELPEKGVGASKIIVSKLRKSNSSIFLSISILYI